MCVICCFSLAASNVCSLSLIFVNLINMSLVAQTVKHLSTMQETQVRSLGWEDPLEKEMAIHSSTVAWKIPWTEKPGRLQSMGLQRVGNDFTFTFTLRWKRNTSRLYIVTML